MDSQSSSNKQDTSQENKETWNPDVNQDEAILEQERQIEKEIADNTPMISQKIDLGELLNEYKDTDKSYSKKIKNLMTDYKKMRRTRPDGNCFYRGFLYAYFELFLTERQALSEFIALVQKIQEKFMKNLKTNFTIEDFYETFLDILLRIEKKDITTVEQLLDLFNEPGLSNYIVVFARIVTSAYLQTNGTFFHHFIEGYISMYDFCSHEVEPMYKESDHIHIIGLTQAFHLPVSICYLDKGKTNEVNFHHFPENSAPKVSLLYRPGHYDILYKD